MDEILRLLGGLGLIALISFLVCLAERSTKNDKKRINTFKGCDYMEALLTGPEKTSQDKVFRMDQNEFL